MDDVIEFKDILKLVRQIWVLIVSITLVLTLVAGVGSALLLQPEYEASVDLLLNLSPIQVAGQQGMTIDQNNITSNLMLIQTYTTVIQSPRILEPAAQQLGLQLEALTKQVSVDNVQDSQVLTIHAQDTDPARAALIANTVAGEFQKEIALLMKVDNVHVLTPAKTAKQVWPRPFLTGSIGLVLGLILSIGYVLLRESLDTRLRTEEMVEQHLGLPLLGKVPVITKQSVREQPQPLSHLQAELGGQEL